MSKPVPMSTTFFLLLIATTTLTRKASGIEAPSPQSAPEDLDELKFAFPIQREHPNFNACWETILSVQGCATSIVQSWLSFQVQLSPQCCKVIQGIAAHCLQNSFTAIFPFNPFFVPQVQSFCSSSSSP